MQANKPLLPVIPPLTGEARSQLATALLGAALVIASVELQRHWGSESTPLYVTVVATIALVGVGALWRQSWVIGNVGWLIDFIIYAQAVGGLALIQAGADAAGRELLDEMLFWTPLLCIWWAVYYGHRPWLAVLLVAGVYVCLYAGGALDTPHRMAHEYLIQGGLAIALALLASRLFADSPESFCRTPAAFDAATHDPLTGVANRLSFEAEVDHVAAMADRTTTTFSLIAIRLDGVAADGSDPALRDAAWRIADCIRHSDSLCRWQNSTFMVLLPNTPTQRARAVAENIRTAVASLMATSGRQVSVKVGTCEYQIGEDPATAITEAEQTV